MAIGTALLGLLAFLLGCSGTSAKPQNSERFAMRKCVLTGNWTNDLASTMQINSVSDTGVFSGLYATAVKNSANPIRPSLLQGVQRQGRQPTFGFTVNWNFAESTTVFVGQCFLDAKGKEQLKTTWLLREVVGSRRDDWRATKVGMNTFYRTK
ncbi:avidin-like [Ahaetulla prasina]|uniref:avidin-like n=1 Tax=Ahaetulla prasina TaxID=499056 RepID=UPI002647A77F|nr:avidin-like [Ahaetulla prasina]